MPKKKIGTAIQELEAGQLIHWRLLLRNLPFQEDMAFLKMAYQASRDYSSSPAQREKWSQIIIKLWDNVSTCWALRRINFIPIELWPKTTHLSLDDILALESHASLFIKPQEHVLVSNDPHDKYLARITPSQPKRFIFVRVDLSHPIENLLPLLEKEIRLNAQKFTKPSKPQIKKIDFQLQVYDCALKGEPFSLVARELHKPIATIKSAYLLAKEKIDSLALKPIFLCETQPNRRTRALASIDPDTHVRSCSKCQNAESFDQMCSQARLFTTQDTRSLPSGTVQLQ